MSYDPEIDVDLAREILRLYLQNPNMVSDVEDLVRWRLLHQRVLHHMEEVRKAAVWLAEKGLLLSQPAPGVPELYTLNGERRAEVERFAASGILEGGMPPGKKPEGGR